MYFSFHILKLAAEKIFNTLKPREIRSRFKKYAFSVK